MRFCVVVALLCLLSVLPAIAVENVLAQRQSDRGNVGLELQNISASLVTLYENLHRHPELSFQGKETSNRIAEELKKAGCEVTTGIGRFGVVGVLRSGDGLITGPTVLVRTDLDALPVKEQTGLSYASAVVTKD